MEKDANYREQLRRDNPDLFRDITYEHIIQELKVGFSAKTVSGSDVK